MAVQLPPALRAYFDAANTDDADRIAAAFSDDAVVHDEGRDIVGRAAIRAWAVESRRKYRFLSEPLSVEAAADRTVVTARVTGDFPGSPVDLTYRFRLDDGQVAALEIG